MKLFVLTTLTHIFIFLLSLFLIYLVMIKKDIENVIIRLLSDYTYNIFSNLEMHNIINRNNDTKK